MEFKTADRDLGAAVIEWDDQELLANLDDEIRSVFEPGQLITPDDVRRGNLTLEQSILQYGWPDLGSARGRIFFLMDNGPDHDVRYAYNEGRPNLEGRVLFTNSAPGNSDCAFQKVHIYPSNSSGNINHPHAGMSPSSTTQLRTRPWSTSRSRSAPGTGCARGPTSPWTRSSMTAPRHSETQRSAPVRTLCRPISRRTG